GARSTAARAARARTAIARAAAATAAAAAASAAAAVAAGSLPSAPARPTSLGPEGEHDASVQIADDHARADADVDGGSRIGADAGHAIRITRRQPARLHRTAALRRALAKGGHPHRDDGFH